jgi:hypothetical protein
MNNNFCIFIITHGRPDSVVTYKTLSASGYTGKVVFVLDDEDKTAEKYISKYGAENIRIFNKKEMADKVDEGNNFDNRRTTTHARNACYNIASDLNIKYFLVLDDDYTGFHHRYISKDGTKLGYVNIKNLDTVLSIFLDFYKSTPFLSIAFAQGGDFIGGVGNPYAQKMPLTRKCMNSFICSTERPFKFIGQLNEDVNTYITLGSRGYLFGTIPMISLVQKATQKTKGGMSEAYLQYGTYCKSFMSVMMMPSSVKVSMMQSNNPRLHHAIDWDATVPKIISEDHKKK